MWPILSACYGVHTALYPCVIKILCTHHACPFVVVVVLVCFILCALVEEAWITPVAQSMLHYFSWSAQSPLVILLINASSFIPLPYSHSPLSTGHSFTVLMVIFIWMCSCKMHIVDLYAYIFKVYRKAIIPYILCFFLICARNVWPCCCATPTSRHWTLL